MHHRFRFLLIGVILVSFGCGSKSSTSSTLSEAGASLGASGSPGTTTASFVLTSTGFTEGGTIPSTFADTMCGGGGQVPPLSWSNVPSGTQSLAISVIDLDFENLIHALAVNIPKDASTSNLEDGIWVQSYFGPCPNSGDTHRYQFKIYALNVASISQTGDPTRALAAVNAATLGTATLTASYTAP